MFQPKVRHIAYRITKPAGETVAIDVYLNEAGLATRLGGDGMPVLAPAAGPIPGTDCTACEAHCGHCPAASALAPVIDAFDDLQSTDPVTAEVLTEGRTVSLGAPAPRVLASLMGLLMASSGCPRLAPFQVMALFHQPFATPEENVVRAVGFWLMRCWAQGQPLGDDPLVELQGAWDSLEDVNRHVAGKILARATSDVASNGIAYLDVLAKIGTVGLESALEVLRPVLAGPANGAACPAA